MQKLIKSGLIAGCLLGGAQVAFGAGMDANSSVVLVPYANFSAANVTTAVGLTARAAGTIHWAFFDQNGNRRARGTETMIANQRFGFIWATEAAAATTPVSANTPGFLVFALDTNGDNAITGADGNNLTAGAFSLNIPDNDVAYIPTVDVTAISDPNPNNWTSNPVTTLGGGAVASGADVGMPYLIAGTPNDGEDTKFYIFTTASPGPSQSMTVHDGSGASKAITVQTLNINLNIIDPETVTDITSSFFGDGSVRWVVPAPGGVNIGAFAFSVIESNAFGAAQTLMGDF
ncbi:MAG: hypothetical protein U1F68_03695 [Gammaproteobacteria bacterium]